MVTEALFTLIGEWVHRPQSDLSIHLHRTLIP